MLTSLFPRPIPIDLGKPAERYLALPLRIRDLVDLEAVFLASKPERFAQPEPGDMQDPAYREAMRNAVDLAEQFATGWGSDACHEVVFGTVGGRAAYLCAVLREHEPTLEEAAEFVPLITVAQWGELDRLAFGCSPLSQIVNRIDNELGIGLFDSPGVPWTQSIIETWTATGLSIDQIHEMTLPAFRTIRRGGEAEDVWGSSDTEFQMSPETQAPKDLQAQSRYAFYHQDRVLSAERN